MIIVLKDRKQKRLSTFRHLLLTAVVMKVLRPDLVALGLKLSMFFIRIRARDWSRTTFLFQFKHI